MAQNCTLLVQSEGRAAPNKSERGRFLSCDGAFLLTGACFRCVLDIKGIKNNFIRPSRAVPAVHDDHGSQFFRGSLNSKTDLLPFLRLISPFINISLHFFSSPVSS